MPDTLLPLLTPPAAFAPNTEAFWNDPHIAGRMLTAHLDPDFEGASRSHGFIERSARWVAGLLPPAEYPRLLDLGCGPGLYATRFAAAGYQVTGVDMSESSIAYAQQAAAQAGLAIRYRVQNYLALAETEAFDAAVLIYCDYGALSAENRALLLQKNAAALRPGGALLLDVFTPHKLAAFEEGRVWHAQPAGGFWAAQPHVALQQNLKYEGDISLEHTVVQSAAGAKAYYIWNQYFTQQRLQTEAEAAGFAVQEWYDDVAGSPYIGGAPTMAALLRKG